LCELGIEEQDESVIPEAVEGFKAFKKEFEALRLETLLTGQYDKNNAILTCMPGREELRPRLGADAFQNVYPVGGEEGIYCKGTGLS